MNNFVSAYRHILLNSPSLYQCIFPQQIRAASLYCAASLGLDKYVFVREKISTQMHNMTEKFREKMIDFTKEGTHNMVFTEDLKNMAHISTPADLELLNKMIKKFHSQNKELRFGNYVFGPVIMRLYHHLDLPDEALKVFEDPEVEGFFEQLMSYHLLMHLLYKHEKYHDVLRVFEFVTKRPIHTNKYPKHLVLLTMASCYKQNTEASFQYAKNLWNDLNKSGHVPIRRTSTFFAYLALNQGAPHVTLEIVSTIKNQNYVTVRNLKLCALADLNRPDDALPMLRNVLEIDIPGNIKNTFTQEAIDRLRGSVEKSKNAGLQREFSQIVKALEERSLIDSKPIDTMICQEIEIKEPIGQQQRSQLHTSFQGRRLPPNSNMRQGLRDMY